MNVTLQLQWVTQAQFAGYIAAVEQGLLQGAGPEREHRPGRYRHRAAATVDDGGSADYAIAWVPKALQSREKGANITDVGQVFQRSGTLQISFKDKNITTAADLKGKTVGDWGFGNEYELFAGMTKAGLDPGKDVKIVQQQFDMNAFLAGDIDAAQAMIYNEYAQVLEAKNPDDRQALPAVRPQRDQLERRRHGDAAGRHLGQHDQAVKDPAFQATTVKFLTASYQGWIYCASHPRTAATWSCRPARSSAPATSCGRPTRSTS